MISRRNFIAATSAFGLASPAGIWASSSKPESSKPEETVGDRFWAWAHAVHSYDNAFGLPRNGTMTPLEGVRYLGVPNVVMVRYADRPAPPYDEYARQFAGLKKVYWSLVGASGKTSAEEHNTVLELSDRVPNMTGVFMDDFFHGNAVPKKEATEPPASCTLAQLEALRPRLRRRNKTLDLGVTLYTHQLNPAIVKHLALCDVVSFWTWRGHELANLEKNFALYESLVPGKRTLLGIYMWDFGMSRPLPVEAMERQCSLGLEWLRKERVEGMIFLATNICDLGIESVKWTKDWIARHANEPMS